jgi:G3E family GTPase
LSTKKGLLNKIDLAEEAKLKEIEGELHKLNPTTPIYAANIVSLVLQKMLMVYDLIKSLLFIDFLGCI